MVWHAAQLRTKSAFPFSKFVPERSTFGMAGRPALGARREFTKATICRISVGVKREGFSTADSLGLASGMRPVESQKSIVPAPRPWRSGAIDDPVAVVPWQLEQFCSKRM